MSVCPGVMSSKYGAFILVSLAVLLSVRNEVIGGRVISKHDPDPGRGNYQALAAGSPISAPGADFGDVDGNGRNRHQLRSDVDEKEIPKLTHEQEQILHALLGGIGPVILPDDKESTNMADNDGNDQDSSPDKLMMKRSSGRNPRPIPEQIHIAYGDWPSEMVIMWSTPSRGSSKVFYGLAPNDFSLMARGSMEELRDWEDFDFQALPYIHRVKLVDLTPGATYSYKVQTNEELSKSYSFTAMRDPTLDGTDWSPKLIVYGDMGVRGGAPSLRLLRKAAREKSVDAILHVGDFAYDMHDEGGKVGDDFMNRIQDIAAYLPYMTCPGNHEIAHRFIHYKYRFSMPRLPWPTRDEMWYSFDMGRAHFISYSTEVYFTDGPIEEQKRWLKSDLDKANDERDVRPWVIAFGHRPMYCSNSDQDDCTKRVSRIRAGLEDLFYDNGVDVIIEAHEHSYERFWPMYQGHATANHYRNPVAPVHVISGAAGCNEFDGFCVNPILGPRGNWSAYRSWLPGLSGFGQLHIVNQTHLHWQQRLADDDQVEDEFWIEQNSHGYFPPHM